MEHYSEPQVMFGALYPAGWMRTCGRIIHRRRVWRRLTAPKYGKTRSLTVTDLSRTGCHRKVAIALTVRLPIAPKLAIYQEAYLLP